MIWVFHINALSNLCKLQKTYSADKENLNADNVNLTAQGILTCTLKGFQCTLRQTWGSISLLVCRTVCDPGNRKNSVLGVLKLETEGFTPQERRIRTVTLLSYL